MKSITFCSVAIIAAMFFAGCNSGEEKKPASAFYEEGFIDAGDSVKLFYRKTGSGKQNLLVPLGYWLYEDFKHLADSLNYTMVFYDMRNRGRSNHITDSTKIGIWQDVEDMEKIRKHFGFAKTSVLGESYLGFMVILYTLKYPEAVDKIIQIGAVPLKWDTKYPVELTNPEPAITDTAAFNKLNAEFKAGESEKNPAAFAKRYWNIAQQPGLVADTSYINKIGNQWHDAMEYENEWVHNFFWHLNHSFKTILQLNTDSIRTAVRSIKQPVLTIHGTKDRNAPYGGGKEWSELLPNAKLVTVPNAAHIPWVEHPEIVFPEIINFLKSDNRNKQHQ